MANTVRTRIAPSPTGFVHIGNAYGALFNWAYARKNKGDFVIRIDDSDQKRHVKGAEEVIYAGLSWLGFDWNEAPDKGGEYGPYRISDKLDDYKNKAEELLKEGKAYEDGGAIRFKNPGLEQKWKDIVRGEVIFPGDQITDFVIIKSDGYPTYNFATVIDDIEMEISHVIRGEEHISNTPRQLALYKAFNTQPPQFAHFPTLRNSEHKKLSKRKDAVSIALFREAGYLPEAILNYLALLGWSHPEGKDIFSLSEFVDNFDLSRVRKAGPFFDTQKLDWVNGMYIREADNEKLLHLVNQHTSFQVTEEMIALIKERITKLSEAEELLRFFFEEPQVGKELFENTYSGLMITAALHALQSVKDWTLENINSALSGEIKEKEFKTGDFYMAMRLSLAGKKVTPPINESMVILGQDKVIHRLEEAQKVLIEIEQTEID